MFHILLQVGAKKKVSDNPFESMRCQTICGIAGKLKDIEANVTNFESADKGLATIAGDVFDVPIRPDIVHRVVRWQLAKRRQVSETKRDRGHRNMESTSSQTYLA